MVGPEVSNGSGRMPIPRSSGTLVSSSTDSLSGTNLNSETETSAQSSFDYAKIVETNPFILPSDDEFFRFKEEEHARKEAEKRRQKKLKIWEKGKGGPTDPDSISRNVRLQELLKGSSKENEAEKYKMPPIPGATGAGGSDNNQTTKGSGITQASLDPGVRKGAQEKENMTEFIAKKKRNVFRTNVLGYQTRRNSKIRRESENERRCTDEIGTNVRRRYNSF